MTTLADITTDLLPVSTDRRLEIFKHGETEMKTYRFTFKYETGKSACWHNLHNDRDARDDATESFNRNQTIKTLIVKCDNKKIIELTR